MITRKSDLKFSYGPNLSRFNSNLLENTASSFRNTDEDIGRMLKSARDVLEASTSGDRRYRSKFDGMLGRTAFRRPDVWIVRQGTHSCLSRWKYATVIFHGAPRKRFSLPRKLQSGRGTTDRIRRLRRDSNRFRAE